MVSVTNSLASRHPELVKEWIVDKNGDLTPDKVTCFSTRDVWWQCPVNPAHQYLMAPQDRNNAHNSCPFCRNAQVTEESSLASQYPELAAQWNFKRNGYLAPSQVSSSYRGKVWWVCPKNPAHEWKSSVSHRTHHRTDCPHCRSLPQEGESLAKLYPVVASEWDYEKNGELGPEEVSISSDKIVWWRCEHGVEWKQTVVHRLRSFSTGRVCVLVIMQVIIDVRSVRNGWLCGTSRAKLADSITSLFTSCLLHKDWEG